MELTKLNSKCQITIPPYVIKKLNLQVGDEVCFREENGKIIFQTPDQKALTDIQEEMECQADLAGFKCEEDVVKYIKDIRKL